MLPPMNQPLRFEPFLRPMPWGGRRIARFLGKNLPTNDAFGESWEVSDHTIHHSRLANASGFGVTLRQLMNERKRELLGPTAERYAVFPWLIKILDANDWLSVQVHPDEKAVQALMPRELAKTEAWLVLDASPSSRVYAGLKPRIGPRELRQALDRGTVADCLHAFTPRAGDFVFLPAGAVHAVGGGVLLAEIQQTSDATFRLFDWNRRDAQGRSRQLHVDESFASIHWDQGPIEPVRAESMKGPLVNCPYFLVEWASFAKSAVLGGQGVLQAWIVTAGMGRFENGEFFMPGDVWLLPASMRAMSLSIDKPASGLLCTLP